MIIVTHGLTIIFRSGIFQILHFTVKIMKVEESKDKEEYVPYINEDLLRERLDQEEGGSFKKQFLLTFAMCFGSFSFGNIINWGGPSLEHIKTLSKNRNDPESDYAWLVSSAPMAVAISIGLWAFIVNRIGGKKTILIQTPVLLLSWFLKGYVDEYGLYWTAHFVTGFCGSTYIYAGLILLIRSTHRKYIKLYYSLFNSCIMLGVLSMNVISKFCNQVWLCVICAFMPVICFVMVKYLPDSPVFLMFMGKQQKAEKALKFYHGKQSYNKELNTIAQYVQSMKLAEDNYTMLQKKVVCKAIFIIFGLQIFKTMTGYYAFLLDSVRIFAKTESCISPYDDNIIFGVVVFATNLAGTLLFLHGDYKLKIPLMFSMGFMCTILVILGFVVHYEITKNYNWLLLVLICAFGTVYNFGMDVIPSIILYQYIPFQVYDFVMKIMTIFHWLMVFCLVRCYMWMQLSIGISITYWVLAIVSLIGFIFICIFIVESKGKSLTQIQLELGGNPVGSRGSKRQRIPNPFAIKEERYYRYLTMENA